ncbi:MAG: AMP-binding protein [Burkholderiales bacterium]|nr:AMP-binding protein [Burkholderiales bacterium]
MFSALSLDAQFDALFRAGECEPIDCGPGDLRVVAARIEGSPSTVVGFDYAIQHGSMGAREADQLVQVMQHARRERVPVVFLMNTSGVRVTEGTVGIAALRRALQAALDARLTGVRMLALIGRNCFGGASVLAAACECRIVNRQCMIGMSGPRMIEQGPGGGAASILDAEAARHLLGGEARALVSRDFLRVDDDAEAYRAALIDWMRGTAGSGIDEDFLTRLRARLRERLQTEGRWPAAAETATTLEGAAATAARNMLGDRYEVTRSGQFLSARATGGGDAFVCGLAGGARADAVDVLQLTAALAHAPPGTRVIGILLDCESHSTQAADEKVILSEYFACLALQIRLLHHRGIEVRLILIGVSGGGVFAALGCAASRVCMARDARLRVLPRAAMAAINKVEGDEEGTVDRALETGAVDEILDASWSPIALNDNGNFYAAVARAWVARRDASCIESDAGIVYSFAEIDRLSARYAHALLALGCEQGDRVAVQVEKSPQALALFLACLRAGIIYLPLNTAYQPAELVHFLADAEPRVFVCRQETLEAMRDLAGGLGVPHVTGLDQDGGGSFTQAAAAYPDRFPTALRSPEDTATILYTSGTTGRSKGAMLSHRALAWCAQTLASCWEFSERDVLLHALPIFHGHGLFVSSCVALVSAARLIFHRKFDATAVREALPRATVFMAVPTFYHRLLADDAFGREACRGLRLFTSGSAPLSAPVHEAFHERSGFRIVERYGATETMILTSNPVHGERRAGSVGRPLPGVELRIADKDDRPMAPGQVGMIQVRGPGLFSGYWRMPEKTREDFTPDGFFRTGDLGTQSEDGYVTITGRAKDMIISGGYNVYPIEVESVLNLHPAVAESAVIGVPHADFGEAVVAVIIASGAHCDPDELVTWVKARLANYKVPKHVVVVDQLPRNALGKVQKNVLRESYADLARSATSGA